MSSSFVKDCSDVSDQGNATSGKTFIIIVNNETGNVSLDGEELQTLLANHGADGSQVSVVSLGSGGGGNVSETSSPVIVPAQADGTTHVNLTVEGYPALSLDGQAGSSGNYTELPLDTDALNRLESVLQSDEAREILGEPLLDMVTHPDQLGTLDQFMDSSFFEGADVDDVNLPIGVQSPDTSGSSQKRDQTPPKRRSQRQLDKAEKEEVVKILAENQKKFEEERQILSENQMKEMSTSANELAMEASESNIENLPVEPESEIATKSEQEKDSDAGSRGRGRGRGRPRGRGRGKVLKDRSEVKGRGRGWKKEEEEEESVSVGNEKGNRAEANVSRGRGRGRGRGKVRNEDWSGGKIIEDSSLVTEDETNCISVKVKSEGNPEDVNKQGSTKDIHDVPVSLNKMAVESPSPAEFQKGCDKVLKGQKMVVMKKEVKEETQEESSSKNMKDDIEEEKASATILQGTSDKRENKHRIIQVKSPKGVRQVVVLNSVKTGMHREPLIKVIPPKDPPKEEDEKAPASKRGLAKKNKTKKVEAERVDSEEKKEETNGKKEPLGVTLLNKDSFKKLEDVGLTKKKEESQKKIEEIQRKREELMKKREAILKKKNQEKEMADQQKQVSELVKVKTPEKDVPVPKTPTTKKEIQKEKSAKKSVPTQAKGSVAVVKVSSTQAVMDESPVRRSGRAIKKKTFGDEMVTFDIAEAIKPDDAPDEEEEEEEPETDDEDMESVEDYGQDDDPERLWCICQKPHNNRFMICCDKCEDWFHGSCVGITKALGQQMEADRQEWVCPKCKKAERAMKGAASPGKKCVVESCYKSSKADSIYCSNDCVLKHAQLSLKVLGKSDKDLEVQNIESAAKTPVKSEPRVLVYHKPTGKISSGTSAPALSQLKDWLKEHPDYAVLQPGMMGASGMVPGSPSISSGKLSGDKNVIQLSPQSIAVPVPNSGPRKVTLMKSSDGRIIVKSTDSSSKESAMKSPTSSTAQTPTKPILVQSVKSVSAPMSSTVQTPTKPVLVKSVKSISTPSSKSTLKSTSSTAQTPANPVLVKSVKSVSTPTSSTSQTPTKQVLVKSVKSLNTPTSSKFALKSPTSTSQTPTKQVLVKSAKSVSTPKSSSQKADDLRKEEFVQSSKSFYKSRKSVDSKEDAPIVKNTPAKESKKVKEDAPIVKNTPAKESKKPLPKPTSVEKKKPDTSEVRENIKKGLADCLIARAKEAEKEYSHLSENDIKILASSIEREIYLYFGKDVGFKYKSRYRSLIFNIKDAKNSGLFRKILNGTISPSNLAKMTSEELASKELAEWRKGEEKKELQAIEKHELDMISLGNQYIMKSHKGEIEIDKDDFIKDKEKAPETLNALPADSVDDINDVTSGTKNNMLELKLAVNDSSEDVKSEKEYKKDSRDQKHKESEKMRERKDRHSSSDKRDRRDSTDKEKHRRKSSDADRDKDRKYKEDKSRDRGRDKDEKYKIKDRSKDDKLKDKQKHGDRERHKSSSSDKDRKERRDSKDKKHKDKHRERRDSKEKDRKSDRKRKHSESRSADRKRRDSERDRRSEKDKLIESEKQKEEVSTSEDIVKDVVNLVTIDDEIEDTLPTSTVSGSPDIMEVKHYSPTPCRGSSPSLWPELPDSPTTPPYPPDSPPYIPPLPEDEVPLPPPLPDSPRTPPLPYHDVPDTPPLPEDDSPMTPPYPDDAYPSTPPFLDDDDYPTTPPLPSDHPLSPRGLSNTPPFPPYDANVMDQQNRLDYRLTPPPTSAKVSASKVIDEPTFVWKGIIHMPDTAKFSASAFEMKQIASR